MPSIVEVLQFRNKMFEDSMSLIAAKGADYCRDQQGTGDTLFNLRVAAILGVVPNPETGILVRLSDKFMRLVSLGKDENRNPAVTGESLRETVKDIHNYVDYLLLLREERLRGGAEQLTLTGSC